MRRHASSVSTDATLQSVLHVPAAAVRPSDDQDPDRIQTRSANAEFFRRIAKKSMINREKPLDL
jgi:hypothetical protein